MFFYLPRAGNSYPGPEALYDYELFALINHEGQIDNGHYTSFARFQDTVRHPPSHLISSSCGLTDLLRHPITYKKKVVSLRRRQSDARDARKRSRNIRADIHGVLRQASVGL